MRVLSGILSTILITLLAIICIPSVDYAAINVGSLTIEKTVDIGQTYKGVITLTNDDKEPAEVTIYQTDYFFQSDGSNSYGEPGTMPRSNAKWITFSPQMVRIPPNGASTVNYTLRVPYDSTLTGTYWSLLMVEEIPRADTLADLRKNQARITQKVRYGIQIVTQIGETGEPKVAFNEPNLILGEQQERTLQVAVENTGNRWIVPTSRIELYDLEGKYVGRFEGEKKRIFPGTSVSLRIDLNKAPHGQFKALVVLDSGEQNVFGAKYNLQF